MSTVRFDRRRTVILGFVCVLIIYEVSYRLSKGHELADLETEKTVCISQLKVAEDHRGNLEAKYKTLEKEKKDEKEKYTFELSKSTAELDASKTTHSKEVQSLREEIAALKIDKDNLSESLSEATKDSSNKVSEITELKSQQITNEKISKAKITALTAQLDEAHKTIAVLQKLRNLPVGKKESRIFTPEKSNNVLPDIVNRNTLAKPSDKLDAPKPKKEEMLPKPQMNPTAQEPQVAQAVQNPVNDLEGKAEGYNQMAQQLSNNAQEDPLAKPVIKVDGQMDNKIDVPKNDNGDQLNRFLPSFNKKVDSKKNDALISREKLKISKDQRKKKHTKEEADFENLNDDDNPDQYDDGAGDDRPDEDKGFEREGHIEEPLNDLGINNEPNEVNKEEAVLQPK